MSPILKMTFEYEGERRVMRFVMDDKPGLDTLLMMGNIAAMKAAEMLEVTVDAPEPEDGVHPAYREDEAQLGNEDFWREVLRRITW